MTKRKRLTWLSVVVSMTSLIGCPAQDLPIASGESVISISILPWGVARVRSGRSEGLPSRPDDGARHLVATELIVQGDSSPLGIFDPSLEYDAAGDGWMVYSAPRAPFGKISTHLAHSRDKGLTWTFVTEINASTKEVVNIGGVPTDGTWRHEVSTIVYDPGDPDPQRRWKLYWHEYFAVGAERKFVTHGWISVRYAPRPEGPWSSRERLFGGPLTDTANYPVNMNLSRLHPSLGSCLVYSEPGTIVVDDVLYMSLLCAPGLAPTHKQLLIRSRDHGRTWEFVSILTDPTDAAALGEISYSASDLVLQGDTFYLILTPVRMGIRIDGSPGEAYSGCHFFRFADLTSGVLERDAEGRLRSVLYIEGDATRFRGACAYDQENVGGGVLLSEVHLGETSPFRILNTHAFPSP